MPRLFSASGQYLVEDPIHSVAQQRGLTTSSLPECRHACPKAVARGRIADALYPCFSRSIICCMTLVHLGTQARARSHLNKGRRSMGREGYVQHLGLPFTFGLHPCHR